MDHGDFVFDAGIAAGCNGNASGDKPYIRWFCREAVARAEHAAAQIRNVATLREWGDIETVKWRLESSWALLRALQDTLSELACAARLKPDVSAPFSEAAERVSSEFSRVERDYARASAWFNART
ncbi:hypothetical protein [Paraburkholderia sp. MM6662-R1]|uniref:hypothetical protein n=1 Tax=Paraburkholderia sp. MM6662-R1 TaxID=2991066 RepID=UPI003D1D0112